MRGRIRQLALELLVRFGVRGCTFGDVADSLSITRANVHYHFGSKAALIDEVLEGHVSATTERVRELWEDKSKSLAEKLNMTVAVDRALYDAFNQPGPGQAWNLITRMRGEEDALSEKSVTVLRRFTANLSKSIEIGVAHAVERRELAADTPVQDVVVQLVSIIIGAGLTTVDSPNFARLEAVHQAFLRMLFAAYPARPHPPLPVTTPQRTRKQAA